jgi:hypothetical protein
MNRKQLKTRASVSDAFVRRCEPAAYSVESFCRAHSLSKSKLYAMLRSGEGPRLMKCGTRTLISVEAARDWRLTRERAADAKLAARVILARRARHRLGSLAGGKTAGK